MPNVSVINATAFAASPSATHFDLESKRLVLWSDMVATVRDAEADIDASSIGKLSADLLRRIAEILDVEMYWAYPGKEVVSKLAYYAESAQFTLFEQLAGNAMLEIKNKTYRKQEFIPFNTNIMKLDAPLAAEDNDLGSGDRRKGAYKTYFEVLVIHPDPENYEMLYRNTLAMFKTERDEFVYDILFVDNMEDALVACVANTNIQACVHMPGYSAVASRDNDASLSRASLGSEYLAFLQNLDSSHSLSLAGGEVLSNKEEKGSDWALVSLPKIIRMLRPELSHYLISELAPADLYLSTRELFDRVLFHIEPFQDLHLNILSGIRERYTTPFFDALRAYSRKPKGVFHALPLSRAQSIKDSPWIEDMLHFYGPNVFLAETSSTQGGMDSLLDPRGAIKQAHDKAAKAFGSKETFFVTNGTSTSNKIVMQANLKPGDIVLISADCHKSIPYAVMLSGAFPVFLETYPLAKYDLYGAVTLERIKEVLLSLKAEGQLHRVKQITLTNSTFDGLIYNTRRFMMNILAIKPDIIFHWDEAWFAFSYFNPLYSGRTAMSVAGQLEELFFTDGYREQYASWTAENPKLADLSDANCINQELMPNADDVRLRVYSTQSTHKTLTSFRQGSMLHMHDVAFNRELFLEAYRMHTSTSPNYQIIASLDAGRRQVSLEGYDRVKRAIRLAMDLREKISTNKTLQRYFTVLTDKELIPESGRRLADEVSSSSVYAGIAGGWGDAEFVVDPTRVTVDVSATGMDGSNFRELLINKYDIQVNKTSSQTVLFIVNIGADQDTIDYLIKVLCEISSRLALSSSAQRGISGQAPSGEVEQLIDLPQRRIFHEAYKPYAGDKFSCVDMRAAYYAAFEEENVTYAPLDNETLKEVMNDRKLVSASFVTPYPPGFPVIVPGQMITHDILLYLQKMKIKEIHGYQPELGLKIFTDPFIASL